MNDLWKDDADLFAQARRELFTAVVGDVMDKLGLRHQFLPPAIQPLERATQLDPQSLEALAPLLTAYDEVGQQSDAVATAERAVRLARSQGQLARANQFSTWLMNHSRSASRP